MILLRCVFSLCSLSSYHKKKTHKQKVTVSFNIISAEVNQQKLSTCVPSGRWQLSLSLGKRAWWWAAVPELTPLFLFNTFFIDNTKIPHKASSEGVVPGNESSASYYIERKNYKVLNVLLFSFCNVNIPFCEYCRRVHILTLQKQVSYNIFTSPLF